MTITADDLRELPAHLPDWIRTHLEQYVGSGGAEGEDWQGVKTLLLKTVGRKSGRPSLLPLIYGPHPGGDGPVIVASKGGAPAHPAWYLNLVAQPEVEVQVGTDQFTAIARTVDEAERDRLWPLMAAIWPPYDDYQQATDRQIPVVVLTRT